MNNIQEDLVTSITKAGDGDIIDDIQDVTIEQADVIADEIIYRLTSSSELGDELAGKIPILKWGFMGLKLAQNIQARNLTKKLLTFHLSLQTTSEKQRAEFLKKLGSNQRDKLIDRLLLVIEKLNDFNKAKVLGVIFEMYVRNKINSRQYYQLIYALENIDPEILAYVVQYYYDSQKDNLNTIHLGLKYYLSALGLYRADNHLIGTWDSGGGTVFHDTELGNLFIECLKDAGYRI